MHRQDNLERLVKTATLLRPVLPEVVFVGGCTTGLLITDPAAPDVRPTVDVDIVAEIVSYAEFTRFTARLGELGFRVDSESGSVCKILNGDVYTDLPCRCKMAPRLSHCKPDVYAS